MGITATLAPKSDQLNSEDPIAGPPEPIRQQPPSRYNR